MQEDDEDAELVRAWLSRVMQQTGLKPTPLAQAAGLAPSTLIRALDETSPTSLGRRSIAKISARFAIPPPWAGSSAPQPGFSEADLLPYEAAAEGLPANQFQRIVNTRALELCGYVPGDVVTLDMSVTPAAGDAVDAQVYSLGLTSAETVFRLYDPPYLVTRSADAQLASKPLLVDGERVRIAAVVVRAERTRKLREA